ncbi:MAG: hypothetical protein WAV04_00665 [Candidatus Microsaccharimonas sp.]
MSTIDRDPKANQPPIQESQLPDINNVLPEAPETLQTTRREVKEAGSKEKKKFPLGAKITAGIAGLALIGGGVALVANQAPKQEPVAEAPADPSNPDTPGTGEQGELLPNEMELEIPVGLSAEQLGETFIDRENAWLNAGTDNQKILDDRTEAGLNNVSMGEFVTDLATEFAPSFANALYVDDWQSRSDIVDHHYKPFIELNAATLERNLKTGDSAFSDGKEAYHYTRTVDAVREISADGTTRVIEIDLTDSNGVSGVYTLTFVNIDGTERIAALSVTIESQ